MGTKARMPTPTSILQCSRSCGNFIRKENAIKSVKILEEEIKLLSMKTILCVGNTMEPAQILRLISKFSKAWLYKVTIPRVYTIP